MDYIRNKSPHQRFVSVHQVTSLNKTFTEHYESTTPHCTKHAYSLTQAKVTVGIAREIGSKNGTVSSPYAPGKQSE
jgi:hypothetical protein